MKCVITKAEGAIECLLIGSRAHPQHTKKSWNRIPIIKRFHDEIHNIGLNKFIEKYPKVQEWLALNGWRKQGMIWDHDQL